MKGQPQVPHLQRVIQAHLQVKLVAHVTQHQPQMDLIPKLRQNLMNPVRQYLNIFAILVLLR